MAVNEVASTGVSVRVDRGGYYHVTHWYLLEGGGRMQQTHFHDLTWREVFDVVVEGLECHRPGWRLGTGWSQPPLPFPET